MLIGVLALTLWFVGKRVTRPDPSSEAVVFPVPGAEIAGVVEVLNGTSVDGLARSVTRALRIGGIDVVYFGTHRPEVDTTKVFVRRGDSLFATVVRDLLGRGVLEVSPDSGLLVDVTVLLGSDFDAVDSLTTP